MATLTRTRPSAFYLVTWGLLASIAGVYMASVSLKPGLVARIAPPVKLATLLLDEDDAELRRTAAEAEMLQRNYYAARAEIASMRVELSRRTDREASLSQQIALLEAREAKVAEAEAAAQPSAVASRKAAVAQIVAKAPRSAPRAEPPAKAEPALSAVERLANASGAAPRATAPIETSSLPPQARVEPTGPAGIVLSTGPSLESLKLNWQVLSQRHQDDLQRLQPRYTANTAPGASGQAYDLVAGPLPSAADAQRVCAALRAKYVSCKVGTFTGNAL
jgi:hypothetical protein